MAWNEPGPGRDPWTPGPGGKRGGSAPDLDELLKRLKARFSGRGGRPPAGGRPGGVAGAVAVLAASLWLLSGFYTIDDPERGVVLRFGAGVGVVEPGLRWHLPWPIETVERVDPTRVRQILDRSTLLTKDQNLVDVEINVQYHISSPEDFLFNVVEPEKVLPQAAAAATRDVVGRSTVDYVLNEGRQAIGERVRGALQQRLDGYRSGLSVTSVGFKAEPPEAVKPAFAKAIDAANEGDKLRNEAQTDANDRLPKARVEAERSREQAAAYREQVIARAEGDAARFNAVLEQYRKAPRVIREQLYLDTMRDVFSSTSKVIVDVEHGNPAIQVPLAEMLRPPPTETAADPAPPAAATAAAPRSGTHGDDTTRPHDRGSR